MSSKGQRKGLIFLLVCLMSMAAPVAAAAGIQVTAFTDAGETKEVRFYSSYHALVIGCWNYAAGWPALPDRVTDARDVAAMLKAMNWTVDLVENPDGQTLRREIQKLVFNQGKDRDKGIMIWFSGHGFTLPEADGAGLGYLVPVDAPDPGIDPVGFAEKAVSLREMETVARQMLAKHLLMIFDANLAGDIFAMRPPQPADRIQESMAAPVRQILVGGGGDAAAAKASILKNLFIDGIRQRLADLNADGCVTAEELGFLISTKLAATDSDRRRFYGRIDIPQLNRGNFVFAGLRAEEKTAGETGTPQAQAGVNARDPIVNSLGMTFNYIPSGSFLMGSPKGEAGRDRDETRHPVTLTRGFYMQTTEVTQKQWQALMGSNPSRFSHCGGDCPVENVNWHEVQDFIQRLNRQDGHGRYRLPTEAEWEYACRAGSDSAIYSGDLLILGERHAPALDAIAWYGGNSCAEYPEARDCSEWRQRPSTCKNCGPQQVGLKEPNGWGLYDMLGNVYEWCQDYFAAYPAHAVTDPAGPANGTRRIARGCAWDYYARTCRSANRNHYSAENRSDYMGFRLVMEAR